MLVRPPWHCSQGLGHRTWDASSPKLGVPGAAWKGPQDAGVWGQPGTPIHPGPCVCGVAPGQGTEGSLMRAVGKRAVGETVTLRPCLSTTIITKPLGKEQRFITDGKQDMKCWVLLFALLFL